MMFNLPKNASDVKKKDDGDPLECDKVLSNSPHLNIELTPRSSAILHGTSSA